MVHDFIRYYDLETYLFEDVYQKFHRERKLDAFDLMSIFIWKAERAKSRLARRLIKKAGSLEAAATQFGDALLEAESSRDRLFITMCEWGFYLPMASTILSVLWPEEFTVYDVRVCEELKRFEELKNLSNFDAIWEGYWQYRKAVRAVSEGRSLRENDQFLWGRSTALQLEADMLRWQDDECSNTVD